MSEVSGTHAEPLHFTFHIEQRETDGIYPLHVYAGGLKSERGVAPAVHERLVLPDRLIARSMRLLEPQGSGPSDDDAELGMLLARQVLLPSVRRLLLSSVAQAREQDRALHLELRIDAPELAALPWEWLTVPGKNRWSPALLDDYGLSRLVVGRQPVADGRRLPGAGGQRAAVRVVLVAPDAGDTTLLAVSAALGEPGRDARCELEVLLAPSARELWRALRRVRPHVLHLLAGVVFDAPDHPQLLLDAPLGGDELAALAAPTVVLLDGNWRRADRSAASLRLAYRLVEQGCEAAIAFHSPLYPDESALFARTLYGALSGGVGLHRAVAAGRRALVEGGAQAAWGLPLLVRQQARTAVVGARQRRGALSPASRRELAVPLVAGGVGLAISLTLIGWGWNAAQGHGADASLPTSRPTVTLPNAFTIQLPTPTFAPPVAAPTPAPQVADVAGTAPLAPVRSWASYVVQQGDSISSIAERMGSTPEAIATLNRVPIEEPPIVGRALMIPVYVQGAPGVGGIDVKVGRQDVPMVALTIDTEINDVMLYQILDILRPRNIRATFFVTGKWVMAYPDAARAIVSSGHEIANHSLTHPNFTAIGADGALAELRKTEDLVVQTTGVSTRPFFRFPYGAHNPELLNLVAGEGYISYRWSADDGAISGWIAAIAPNPRSGYGGILLIHQRSASIAALPGWLDQLDQIGMQVVPLSQILR